MTAAELFWRTDAAVFDLDGTLVDTLEGLHAALNEALGEHGLAPVGRACVRDSMHGGFDATVRRVLAGTADPERQAPGIAAAYRARYRELMVRRSTLYPSVREALEQQKARGCRVGVCTNRDEALALELLAGLGLRGLFDAVVGLRDGIQPKPDPHMLQLALNDLGALPTRAVMVGDSAVDVDCAARAGVACLVFTGGYGAEGAITRPGVRHFDSYTALTQPRGRTGGLA